MKYIKLTIALLLLALSWLLQVAEAASFPPYVMPKTQVIPLADTDTKGQYELLVKLPPDYTKQPNKRYPVIYYTDAVWHIEMLSSATEFILEEVILVGVSWQKDYNIALQQESGEYVSRFKDYSIAPSTKAETQAKYQMGQGDKHLRFISEDVIPYVEQHFRTAANQRAYFGYSLGGLFGAYVLVSQPNTFDYYMLGSPSVWRLENLTTQATSKSITGDVFITHGDKEEELGPKVASFVTWLEAQNSPHLSVSLETIPGTHQTAAPKTAIQATHWFAGKIQSLSSQD